MKKILIVLALMAGLSLPFAASARTDVHIGVGLGFPAYYYEPEPVYVDHYYYPRYHHYQPRHHGHHRHNHYRGHDRGHHRGHHKGRGHWRD